MKLYLLIMYYYPDSFSNVGDEEMDTEFFHATNDADADHEAREIIKRREHRWESIIKYAVIDLEKIAWVTTEAYSDKEKDEQKLFTHEVLETLDAHEKEIKKRTLR